MKVRKTPIALLLLLTCISLVGENKARVTATVTKEESSIFMESTKFILGESKEGYLLLNKPKDEEKKEYLNAYFTYNENGLYVDGTDPVPLELLNNRQGYLSIGFNYDRDWNGNENYVYSKDQPSLWNIIDLGAIKMTLTEDPIYWKVVTHKGVYETSKEELEDSVYIKEILPQTLDGLKGYMVVQEGKDMSLSGKIDLVPMKENSSIFCINDWVNANNLLYNNKLYQYVMEDYHKDPKLMVTANYQFKIILPNDIAIEGKITFTKSYLIENQSFSDIN